MQKDYQPAPGERGLASPADFIGGCFDWEKAGRTIPGPIAQVLESETWRAAKPWLEGLPPGSRVLDGGCGTGEWALHLAGRGLRLTAVDIQAPLIARLQELNTGCDFRVGDLSALPDAAESYDAYYSWGTFEHFELGLAPCLTEAWRVLKPGGRLLFTVPFQNWRQHRRQQAPLAAWDENYDPDRGYGAPLRFYQWRLTAPELARELARQGFADTVIQPVEINVGLTRMLRHDLGLNPAGLAGRWLRRLGRRLLPPSLAAHMLFATARKGTSVPCPPRLG